MGGPKDLLELHEDWFENHYIRSKYYLKLHSVYSTFIKY